MEKQRTILLFSDLEGTILREEDGKYDDETMYRFLEQLDRLQRLTDSIIRLHIVSPVDEMTMSDIINKIDQNIMAYNKIHSNNPDNSEIMRIDGAAASQMEEFNVRNYRLVDKRVSELRKVSEADPARQGKAIYVKEWVDMIDDDKSNKELVMAIYCGNGMNDLSAMECIKGQRQGYVICPENTHERTKKLATVSSKSKDLEGIIEGITKINEEIEKRVKPQNEKVVQEKGTEK